MKNIIRAYYFIFYTFWGFFESNPLKWGTLWKAGLLIDILEVCLIISVLNYYMIFINRHYDYQITSPELFVPVILVLVINNYVFYKDQRWEKYAFEFEKLTRQKKIFGNIMVILFVLITVGVLINSYYLMSQINWKLYVSTSTSLY